MQLMQWNLISLRAAPKLSRMPSLSLNRLVNMALPTERSQPTRIAENLGQMLSAISLVA